MEAKAPRPSESQHWYRRDGTPQYTVMGKNGKERPATLRDARTMDLVPSVTTIIKVAANAGLDIWKQQQVLMAALTLPRGHEESDESFIARIMTDSREQGRAAAERGTDMHADIQDFYEGNLSKLTMPHVEAAQYVIKTAFGYDPEMWIAEKSFGGDYGGKVDLHCAIGRGLVLDIKTKDFAPDDRIDKFDDHCMQLAAYRKGLDLPTASCGNIFLSRTHPGQVRLVMWTEEELQRGENMFNCLKNFWYYKTNLKADQSQE